MRFIGLDVHRDFCEVAIAEVGRVRLAGRVQTGPQALALFAQSLAADDQAALEATGDALEIARILEPHVGRVVLANPKAVKGDHPCGRKDRQDRRARWRGCSPAACCRRSGCRTSRPASCDGGSRPGRSWCGSAPVPRTKCTRRWSAT